MISLGVIGLGSQWEDRYRPALDRLRQRLRVRALYDPVFGLAEIAASEQESVAEYGLVSLARRSDVDAFLLLDTSWHGCEALRLLCSTAKPIYIAADLGDEPSMLLALHWTAVNFGMTLMPELGVRYTPSSNRLQELMATKLGRPKRIRLCLGGESSVGICPTDSSSPNTVDTQSARRTLIDWFDWLRYVIRTAPASVQMQATDNDEIIRTGPIIRIEYSTPRNSDVTPIAELHFTTAEKSSVDGLQIGRPEVECEHGTAVIASPTVIRWKSHGDEKFVTESLLSDRSEVDVMLDHFCRRVVGGLIPVADLSDISHSLELIKASRESFHGGTAVQLNGHAR